MIIVSAFKFNDFIYVTLMESPEVLVIDVYFIGVNDFIKGILEVKFFCFPFFR